MIEFDLLIRSEGEKIAISFSHEARSAEMKKLHCIIVLCEASAERSTAHHEAEGTYMMYVAASYFLKESMHTCGVQLTPAFMQHSLCSRSIRLWSDVFFFNEKAYE